MQRDVMPSSRARGTVRSMHYPLSSFFNRFSSRWNPSRFSELPTLGADDDEVHLDYRLLAGGLALLLSRCSERSVERDFAASLQAYVSLRSQLKSRAPVCLSAQVLMDLSHEIAQLADGATRQAARRCLARSTQASACAAAGMLPIPSH
jgi:hypothetical protein